MPIVDELPEVTGYKRVMAWGLRRVRVGLDEMCVVEKNCALEVRPNFEVDGLLVLEGVIYVMKDGE